MAIKTEKLSGPQLYGYVAQPEDGARGGVLLLPTIFGVNEFARGYADTLANAGLVAVVWDINSGLAVGDRVRGVHQARPNADGRKCRIDVDTLDRYDADGHERDLDRRRWVLHRRPVCVVGGRRGQARKGLRNGLSVNRKSRGSRTRSEDALGLAAEIACPVHLIQPGHDHVSSEETYTTLKQGLLQRAAATIVQYHPEAEHGFMHRDKPEANKTATALASPQLIAFLKACLN